MANYSDIFPVSTTISTSGITELLLHAENSTDSSYYPKIITNNSVTVSSAQSKFGTNSFLFNNSTSNYLNITDNAFTNSFWWFSDYDFILELFFYLNGTSFPQQLMGVWGGSYSWRMTLNSSTGYLLAVSDNGGATRTWGSGSNTWATGQWYHLAFSRKGSNCYSWLDGTLKSTVDVSAWSVAKPNRSLEIGRNGDVAWPFNGYMDEIRLVKGYGVTTMSVPTSAYNP